MRDTVAVVVTYNRKDLLMDCIEHLKKQTCPVDIMVIDNASTDGTSELFSHSDDQLYYYNTGSNLGGAGGFHYGMKKAVEMGYKFIWVMDDDTIPTDTAHEMLLKTDKRLQGNYGFLSSKVLWKDESLCVMNVQKCTKWKRLKSFEKDHPIQYASFVSLFLKRETIVGCGLPYKEFFIWSDDWEYTRRLSKRMKCYYVADSVVCHKCNVNMGANIATTDDARLERFKYLYRNDVVLYRQDGLEGYIYLFLRNMLHRYRVLKNGRHVKEKFNIIKNATKEGKTFYPAIEYPKGE